MKYKGGRVPDQEQDRSGMCPASGCPLRASVQLEGKGWLCSAHAWADPVKWPAITEALLSPDIQAMRGFMTDLMRNTALDSDKAWRPYAESFWTDDPGARPLHAETRTGYLHRMHDELLRRVGAK